MQTRQNAGYSSDQQGGPLQLQLRPPPATVFEHVYLTVPSFQYVPITITASVCQSQSHLQCVSDKEQASH